MTAKELFVKTYEYFIRLIMSLILGIWVLRITYFSSLDDIFFNKDFWGILFLAALIGLVILFLLIIYSRLIVKETIQFSSKKHLDILNENLENVIDSEIQSSKTSTTYYIDIGTKERRQLIDMIKKLPSDKSIFDNKTIVFYLYGFILSIIFISLIFLTSSEQ